MQYINAHTAQIFHKLLHLQLGIPISLDGAHA